MLYVMVFTLFLRNFINFASPLYITSIILYKTALKKIVVNILTIQLNNENATFLRIRQGMRIPAVSTGIPKRKIEAYGLQICNNLK